MTESNGEFSDIGVYADRGDVPLQDEGRLISALQRAHPMDLYQFLPGNSLRIFTRGLDTGTQQPRAVQDWRELSERDNEIEGLVVKNPNWLSHIDRPLDREARDAWIAGLPTTEDFTEAAREILAAREQNVDSDVLICDNTQNIKSDGLHSEKCAGCRGVGYISKYPKYIVKNGETLEETTLTLDLASLIVGGQPVEVVHEESQFPNKSRAARSYRFRLDESIENLLPEIGISTDTCVFVESLSDREKNTSEQVMPVRYTMLEDQFPPGSLFERYWWQLEDGQEKTGSNLFFRDVLTPAQLIEKAQRALANKFESDPKANPHDADGPATSRDFLARELPSTSEGFNRLRRAIESEGYTLGVGCEQAVHEDEDNKWNLFVLDPHGTMVASLDTHPNLRVALFSAFERFHMQFQRDDE